MNSQSQEPKNFLNSQPLTDKEKLLIAAFRTNNPITLGNVLLEIHDMSEANPGDAERIGEKFLQDYGAPQAAPVKPPLEYLDSAERLALHIVGTLAIHCQLTRRILHEEQLLLSFCNDIEWAIRTGLPHLDSEEMRRLMKGESAN